MVNKNVVAAVAGGLGLAFIGYCFYFDKKRRSDPDFKKKLKESNKLNYYIENAIIFYLYVYNKQQKDVKNKKKQELVKIHQKYF